MIIQHSQVKNTPTEAVRALFVSHTTSLVGGADLCLKELMDSIDQQIVIPYVVLPKKSTDNKQQFAQFLLSKKIPFKSLEIIHWIDYGFHGGFSRPILMFRFIKNFFNRIKSFIELIRDEQIDVVYTNTVTVFEGAFAAFLTGKPHIWHIHESVSGNIDLRPVLPTFFVKSIVSFFSQKIIVPSGFLAYKCFRFNKNDQKISVIPNGVDLGRFRPDSSAKRRLCEVLEISLESKIIASVGNFTDNKRIEDFITSFSFLKCVKKDVIFLIIGSGSASKIDELIGLSRNLGVAENLKLLGWNQAIEKIFSGVDLLVITSQQETFGRTVIEAMACGVPVISTLCGGPSELIKNHETGILVPVGSPFDIAQAIEKLLSDNDLATNIRKNAFDFVASKFGIENYVSNIQQIIIGI